MHKARVSPAPISQPASREHLLGLVAQARSELAATVERLRISPASPEFATAGLLALELDEVQRAMTRVREPADLVWAAVLRDLATTCTGDWPAIKDLLIQAAVTAGALARDGRPGSELPGR